MFCAVCGGPVEIKPFVHDGNVYEAPLYFAKANQSKKDFAGPDQRIDFCSVKCAHVHIVPRTYGGG